MNESHREAFEDRAFRLYFIKTIERNPNPPPGTGAMDFISGAKMTKVELCARDAKGGYVDEVVQQLWAGWQMALGGMFGDAVGDAGAQVAHDVIAEVVHDRRRVTAEKDDATTGELAMAAAGLALHAGRRRADPNFTEAPLWWPADVGAWEPGPPRENLVRACALAMREIARLDRVDLRAREA